MERTARLLYLEAVGYEGYKDLMGTEGIPAEQLYDELAPRPDDPATEKDESTRGALGDPPAIFVKTDANGNPGFGEAFRWFWILDQPPYSVMSGTLDEFIAARSAKGHPVNWPEFKERMSELNHENAGGSRTGDIVVIMNGENGYLTCVHGDMLNGWHGGPTEAESNVPLMFSMPGPDLIRVEASNGYQPAFVGAAFADGKTEVTGTGRTQLRNYDMGLIIKKAMEKVRTRPE